MSTPLTPALVVPPASTGAASKFSRFLGGEVLTALVKASGKRFYQRLFTPLIMVWSMVFQRLNADHTCDAVVSYLTSGGADHLCPSERPLSGRMSGNTAGYCKARARLPVSVLQGALRHTGQGLQTEQGAAGEWHGRQVGILDGSTVRLAATTELIDHYGRARNQHGTPHWPLLRLVAGFDLFSGAVLEVAEGPYRTSEQTLACHILQAAKAAVVWVGDANFGKYHIVQVAHQVDAELVVRLTKAQAQALAPHKLLSGEEVALAWHPSATTLREPGLPATSVAGRLLYVRLERPGFRPVDLYLFTTLTEALTFTLEEIVKLYGRRWEVELDLRYLKTTLTMDSLPGLSVDIVRKELYAGMVAYNLVRGLMSAAAQRAGLKALQLSFTRCWRRVVDLGVRKLFSGTLPTQAWELLLTRLSQCLLPKRLPDRVEPRAVWGKPQTYPRLKGSREAARQATREARAKES